MALLAVLDLACYVFNCVGGYCRSQPAYQLAWSVRSCSDHAQTQSLKHAQMLIESDLQLVKRVLTGEFGLQSS